MAQICVAADTYMILDDVDWAEFSAFDIHLVGAGYPSYRKNRRSIYVHKEIYKNVDPNYNGLVDHEDRNKLNCQRYNLRPATKSQDCMNQKLRDDNTSGRPGVYYYDDRNQWSAKIRINRKLTNIGFYDSREEAIAARKEVALRLHGHFAKEH
jgi:hypothetical protein